ncbi:hypothetical protein, partial [Lactiplantibacillus pentosus]|uniref:hypothetical protein n=2 Tax=Bacilli TaxID=91061 RepID=UPI0021823E1A
MTNSIQSKSLMYWKATLAFPSPTAASVVVKLTSAWQCGATTVLKRRSAVFADRLFGLSFLFKNLGRKTWGHYDTPHVSIVHWTFCKNVDIWGFMSFFYSLLF